MFTIANMAGRARKLVFKKINFTQQQLKKTYENNINPHDSGDS